MRYYVLTKGSPDFIWAEWAVSQEASAWAEEDPVLHRPGLPGMPEATSVDVIMTRAELLAVPQHREALERWERRDDATFESARRAEMVEMAADDRRSNLRLVR